MKKKICMVIARYGLEVNGGAELQCRKIAEKLLSRYSEVHVLTTKALDYLSWEDSYNEDDEIINGVKVHRFGVKHPRIMDDFHKINWRFLSGNLDPEEEPKWLEAQGPYSPGMIQYISDHKDDYDVFIFFIYLYYPTVIGLPLVKDKAILVSEAHEEPYLMLGMVKDIFYKPRAIMFNTYEEQALVHGVFGNNDIPNRLGGIGIEIPDDIDVNRFKKKYNVDKYIVYVGRVDEGKGCNVLFDYFREYKRRNPSDLKLVLMGKPCIDIPDDPDILSLGFVDEEDKYDGIAGAEVLVLPSAFESLSIVVLEAMAVYTSVMVYGKCKVLKGHCTRSNGAFYYNDYFEFEGQLNYLFSHPEERKEMLENAHRYVLENYQWDILLDRLDELIDKVE